MRAIVVNASVTVPEEAMSLSVARSSGPGGQNVNRVSSKVDVRVDLERIVGLHPEALERLRALVRTRLDAEGKLIMVSQRTRDQGQNLEDALEKIRALVLAATVRPVVRRATKPTRGSVQRRLNEKKRDGARKADRRSRGDD
jgi:ribosome-associated protein